MKSPLWLLFVALQIFPLLFVLLHDWLPLGHWNDVAAFHKSTTLPEKILSLLIPSAPVAFGLTFTLLHTATPHRVSFRLILAAVYGSLFLGELEAWWIPYAFGASAERVARYRALFSATHSFLPARHGITPNSLHVALHASTLATLILIWAI